MAQDTGQSRTYDPTPRRMEQAREEGQVAISADLNTGLMLMAATLVLYFSSGWMIEQLTSWISEDFRNSPHIEWGVANAKLEVQKVFVRAFLLMAPFVATLLVVAFGLATFQAGGFKLTPKAMELKLDRLNPQNGLKRLFSKRAAIKGILAILKATLIFAVLWWIFKMKFGEIQANSHNVRTVVHMTMNIILMLMFAASGTLTALGLIDFFYQRYQHFEDLKMTREEVVQEYREVEGDPHLKARMKKIAKDLAHNSQLQDVKDSTGVIRNPTHYAIAFKYDRATMSAPIVVAKGKDRFALKIIEVAEENEVPVIENRPLARSLYAAVEVGMEIPPELYAAVAKIISYILGLRRSPD